MAGILFVLPGFAVILALCTLYVSFEGVNWFEAAFFGLKAAVLAVVLEALLRLSKRALPSLKARLGALLAFFAIFAAHVPFPIIILVAACMGWLASRGAAEKPSTGNDNSIEATYPPPAALPTLLICGGLWAAPVLIAAWVFGWGTVFPQLGIYFSKLAVVTFGGAYAVLAYVAQAAVETYGWLRPGEMMDGLALAETTPGPLVLVLSFVGFVAAFREASGLPPLLAGVMGATLTMWVTFVPCFLWIFLGAPYVEKIRQNAAFSGALSAILAAVVGVVLNLSLWFAMHVLFKKVERQSFGPFSLDWPVLSSLDWQAAVLSLCAIVALLRLHLGMLKVLGLSALAGLGMKLML